MITTGLEVGNLLNIGLNTVGLLLLLLNILFFQEYHVPYVSNIGIMKNSQQRPVNPGEMLFKTDLNGIILSNFFTNHIFSGTHSVTLSQYIFS